MSSSVGHNQYGVNLAVSLVVLLIVRLREPQLIDVRVFVDAELPFAVTKCQQRELGWEIPDSGRMEHGGKL